MIVEEPSVECAPSLAYTVHTHTRKNLKDQSNFDRKLTFYDQNDRNRKNQVEAQNLQDLPHLTQFSLLKSVEKPRSYLGQHFFIQCLQQDMVKILKGNPAKN